jgi:hypothetical protein
MAAGCDAIVTHNVRDFAGASRFRPRVLALTGKSTNIRYRIGDGLVSDTDPVEDTTFRLIRIQ